jgi:hypothetical protein
MSQVNPPMWNSALIKSGSLARISATSGLHLGRLLGWGWANLPPIGTSPAELSPWEWGLGGVVLGDSASSELCGFTVGFRLGIALQGEAFLRLGAFARLGEVLVPLKLWGSSDVDSDFWASGLRVSSTLGISLVVSWAFTEESGWISCRALYDEWSKKSGIMEYSS